MNFALIDTGGTCAAVLAGGIVVAVPGYALAWLFRFSHHDGPSEPLAGVLVGLAVLPAVDSLAVRFCGIGAALWVTLALAALGAGLVVHTRAVRRPSWIDIALIGAWLAIVLFEWIDFDVAGKLYQPLTIFDTVKHAATAQAIFDTGAPPRDAFFLRPERSSYYYFFYTPAALVMRLCGGLVDAKSAVGGLVFWTGLGAFGLVRLTLARLGEDALARRTLLIVGVMAAGGLDILAVVYFAWTRSFWMADPLQWNDVQVGAWFEDLLWVPHHVSALIAGMLGVMALTGLADRRSRGIAAATIFAGICFASCFGLSIWVTLGFVVTIAVWGLILTVEKRWDMAAPVAVAGAIALVIAVPQFMDLRAGRADIGPAPIALAVRTFYPVHMFLPDGPLQTIGDALCLPINYGFEFGVLLIGSLVYWRQRRNKRTQGGEFGRVLTIAALSCLLVGAFLRSTLINNDLGWRILLMPLLAGTVWTVAALHRLGKTADGETTRATTWRPMRPAVYAMVVIGWATVLYTAVFMRVYPFVTVNKASRFIAADPATARDLRVAVDWVSTHLEPTMVLQQNPTPKRTFAFGVYGRNPIGVADTFSSLYGADPDAVIARIEALRPVFETSLPISEIGRKAAAVGIDDIVVTAADPVWAQPESFVWRVKPVFASSRVRIIPATTLEAAR